MADPIEAEHGGQQRQYAHRRHRGIAEQRPDTRRLRARRATAQFRSRGTDAHDREATVPTLTPGTFKVIYGRGEALLPLNPISTGEQAR
jgi:hypothetical protein